MAGNKNSGRLHGSLNAKNELLQGFIRDICDGGRDKFRKELGKLEGKDFINAYMAMFEYYAPKLARQELTSPKDQPITIRIVRE